MIGSAFCLVAAFATFLVGRRGLAQGFCALLTVGYAYGILRARFPDGYSHFMFDAAVVGLYLAAFLHRASPLERWRQAPLVPWVLALVAWPVVLFLIPLQHPLVQLVGLRSVILFLPLLLVGARLGAAELFFIARWLAWLNLVAFGFAVAEYIIGIERFFPLNPVTELIYLSRDLVGHTAYRIPATFPNAHAYAGTMVATFPYLIALWWQPDATIGARRLAGLAVAASTLGIFMTGARQHALIFFVLAAVLLLSIRLRAKHRLALLFLGAVVALVVMRSERMQRFTTLADIDMVVERVYASANLRFFEILVEYPLGAGLARAFGTSIPFFLAHLAEPQIGIENEYGRLLLELGLPGLLLWLAFLAWVVVRRPRSLPPRWAIAQRLLHAWVAVSWGTAFIGTGTLSSIPAVALLMVAMGILARRADPVPRPSGSEARPLSRPLQPATS